MIVCATGCFHAHVLVRPSARIEGPSLSRKKRLRAANDRPSASDAISSIPLTMPWMNVDAAEETLSLVVSLALEAPDESTPASVSQPSTFSAALLEYEPMSPSCEVMPPITSDDDDKAIAIRPRSTSAAPAARGRPCRLSQMDDRRGDAGDDERDQDRLGDGGRGAEKQYKAAEQDGDPDEEPAASPRSRSQRGAVKTAEMWSTSAEDSTWCCFTLGFMTLSGHGGCSSRIFLGLWLIGAVMRPSREYA